MGDTSINKKQVGLLEKMSILGHSHGLGNHNAVILRIIQTHHSVDGA